MQQSVTMRGENTAFAQGICAGVLDVRTLDVNLRKLCDDKLLCRAKGCIYTLDHHGLVHAAHTVLLPPHLSAGSIPWPACFHQLVMTQKAPCLVYSWKLPYHLQHCGEAQKW